MTGPIGKIDQVMPSFIAPGRRINIYVTLHANYPGAWPPKGFSARIKADLGGFSGKNDFWSLSDDIVRERALITLSGVMPNRPITGYVILEGARHTSPWTHEWIMLDTWEVTIGLPKAMETVQPVPAPIKKEPYVYYPDEDASDLMDFFDPLAGGTEEEQREKTSTMVWVGLGVVAVVGVALVVRR